MKVKISVIVTFCAISFLEAVLTLLGNIFTIFVFWKRRAELKRTSYLLVNLAFADLLVAISISYSVGSGIRYLAADETSLDWVLNIGLDLFCGAASLLSLLVISLERLCAVRWPFRHRALSTRSYLYSIAFVWVMAGISVLLYLEAAFKYFQIGVASGLISILLAFLALVIICAAYILIYKQTHQNIPEGFIERRAQQNKKLTKTLIIVTVLSLICWLPGIIVSILINLTSVITDTIGAYNAIFLVKMLQYGNSIVNPIVYTFRMPLYTSEIKEIFSKLSPAKKRSFYVSRAQQIVTVSQQRTVSNVNVQHFDTRL